MDQAVDLPGAGKAYDQLGIEQFPLQVNLMRKFLFKKKAERELDRRSQPREEVVI